MNKKDINEKSLRGSFTSFFILLYLFNTIFIPYDTFLLKKISFVIIIVFNLDIIIQELLSGKKDVLTVFLFAIILPVYSIIKSVLMTGVLLDNINSGYTGMILLLFLVIRNQEIDFIKPFVFFLVSLSLFLIISALLDYFGVVQFYDNRIITWLHNTENANIGRESRYLLSYYFFVKTTPMLIVGLGYLLYKKHYLVSFIVLFALILSGTRANAVLGLAVFYLGFIFSIEDINNRVAIGVGTTIIFLFVFFGFGLFDKILYYFESKAGSDKVRTLTLSSILNEWKNNPISFFIGQGYSSSFFNTGRLEFTSDVELSYWNLLRRVGALNFILFMYCFVKPLFFFRENRDKLAVLFSYFAFLMCCYIDPLLYTSTGVTVMLFIYCVVFMDKKTQKDELYL